MVIVYCLVGVVIWIILYILVYKIGLFIIDKSHMASMKKWGMDIVDYEYERKSFKLYVRLFFAGLPLLLIVGMILELLS